MLKVDEKIYELSKMAVDPNFQGNSIGNTMVDFCIGQAKIAGAEKIILYSNTVLLPAIHLYKKFGFVEVPLGELEYERANIKMELNLNK